MSHYLIGIMILLHYLTLLIAIVSFLIGILVLKRGKNAENITFGILALINSIWVFSNVPLIVKPSLFILQLQYSLGFLVLVSILIFVVTFNKKRLSAPWLIPLGLLGIIGFVLPHLNGIVIQDLILNQGKTEFVKGALFDVYGLCFLVLFIPILWLLIRKFRRSMGIERLQSSYILLGVGIFSFVAICFAIVLPLFGITPVAPIDAQSSIFFVGFSAYAIAKHKLMDIRFAILKSIVFSSLILLLTSLYVIFVYIWKDFILSNLNINHDYFFIFASFIIALSFLPLKRTVEKVTDKIFFKDKYNPQEVLKEIGQIISSTLKMEDIRPLLLKTLKERLRLAKANLEIYHENEDNHCLSLFKEDRKILVTDEIENSKAKQFLRENKIGMVVPLEIEKKLIGAIIFGEKKSGDIFNEMDISFGQTLSTQLALSIQNAITFNEVLKDREKIKKLLKEREELDKLKDEFIAIASHEVNTPLSIASGYLSLIMESKEVLKNKDLSLYADSAFQGVRRISVLLTTLMSASKITAGKPVLDLEDFDLSALVKESFEKFRPFAAIHKIDFNYENKSKNPLIINADRIMIKEVFDHLLDNAFKFTPSSETKKQKISILINQNNNEVECAIKDSGIGIEKSKLSKLFEKFYQVDTSYTRETQGTGLGLYISQEILKLHNSKINVNSAKGIGTEFSFALKLKRK